ncbi:MAG: NAD(P)-binding protein, partial [Kiloniellales bacterium]
MDFLELRQMAWIVVHQRQSASRFDLIVIGGGMTGLALAGAVAGAGLRVLLIEQRALELTTAPPFDGRV